LLENCLRNATDGQKHQTENIVSVAEVTNYSLPI